MSWNAKPRGGYTYASEEGTENILEIKAILSNDGFTDEAITGVAVNCLHESGLNPWRWESDIYPPTAESRGCGLFGFTPYARYLALQGSNQMNLSVTTTTPGASPNVGTQQVNIMANGTWGWVATGWRSYWDVTKYPQLYSRWLRCADKYGTNGKITIAQYKAIDDYHDAVLVFLCCFEGPNVPNFDKRDADSDDIYSIISGEPPVPPTEKKKSMPVWMMVKLWC